MSKSPTSLGVTSLTSISSLVPFHRPSSPGDASKSIKVTSAVSVLSDSNGGGVLRLASKGPNSAPLYGQTGIAFSTTPVNVQQGFVTDVEFRFDGSSDGFAFVIQRGGLDGWNGGTGANLGRAGFDPALRVDFDMCPLRSMQAECGEGRSITLSEACSTDACDGTPDTDVAVTDVTDYADGAWHTTRISYTPSCTSCSNHLVVSVDGVEVLAAATWAFNGLRAGGDAVAQLQTDNQAYGYINITSLQFIFLPSFH